MANDQLIMKSLKSLCMTLPRAAIYIERTIEMYAMALDSISL